MWAECEGEMWPKCEGEMWAECEGEMWPKCEGEMWAECEGEMWAECEVEMCAECEGEMWSYCEGEMWAECERESCIWKYMYHICIYLTPPHEQDVTQCQFLKRSLTGFNPEFSFSSTGCLAKAEDLRVPCYLLITGGRIIGFMPFRRVFVLMWNAISLIQDLNSCHHVHFLRRHVFKSCASYIPARIKLSTNRKHWPARIETGAWVVSENWG